MTQTFIPQEVIRRKRDNHELTIAEIGIFVQHLASGELGNEQVGAFAMAVFLNGMADAETVALTKAMRDSGQVLEWSGLQGPVIDKHSTGGVGDKLSLLIAPILAECGAFVPMISGRGLGHTGGTLDKLDSIPGYNSTPSLETLRTTVRDVGCAIVGQTNELAPADRRLYAIRDVTATVESIPLITSSILSKKLAAGLDVLVMDVKYGSGAFMVEFTRAQQLAQTIVNVAGGAGVRCSAILSDMGRCLGRTAGNALEVLEAVQVLKGEIYDRDMIDLSLALCAEALAQADLASNQKQGMEQAKAALQSGKAAERFARMIEAMGGPSNFVENPERHLSGASGRTSILERASD
ncbi:MAG: thymidine phosphorylase, partial [Pseudomonadota bacterium]